MPTIECTNSLFLEQIDTINEVKIEKNEVTWDCLYEVREYLLSLYNVCPSTYKIGFELVNENGKVLRRIINLMFRVYGIKLTDSDKNAINRKIEIYAIRSRQAYYDFTEKFNWNAGDFNDEGSCYWGDRTAARDTLEFYHARAIRFYKDSNGRHGIGRAWLCRVKNYPKLIVMYNAYGEYELKDIAPMLHEKYNLNYKPISLVNDGTACGVLYINSGTGYILSQESLANIPNDFDLRYKIQDGEYTDEEEDCYTCSNCNMRVSQEDVCTNENSDNYYCKNCFNELYSYCENCDSTVDSNDIVQVDTDKWICENCAKELGYEECKECGTMQEDCVETNEGIVCNSCLHEYAYCENCDTWVKISKKTINTGLCRDCANELENPGICISCNDIYSSKLMENKNLYTSNVICPSCYDSVSSYMLKYQLTLF